MPFIERTQEGVTIGVYSTQQGNLPFEENIPSDWIIKQNDIASRIEALRSLQSNDWKVFQYLEELAAGVTTTMTEQEFLTLFSKRQNLRNILIS